MIGGVGRVLGLAALRASGRVPDWVMEFWDAVFV